MIGVHKFLLIFNMSYVDTVPLETWWFVMFQKDFPQTSSPVYADHSHPSSHIMLEQAPNQGAFLNPLQESSMGITDPETRSPSIAANACIPHLGSHSVQSMLNDNLGGTPVTCSASTDKTVNLHQGENESVSGTLL